MKWTPKHFLGVFITYIIIFIPVIILGFSIGIWKPLPMWILLIILPIMLFNDTKMVIQSYIMKFASDGYTPQDITAENRPLPITSTNYDLQLRDLGFELSGQKKMPVPMEKYVQYEWQYSSQQDATYASIFPPKQGYEKLPTTVQFVTWFEGPRIIITIYPYAARTNNDSLQITGIKDSVDAAYNYHMHQVAKAIESQGQPLTHLSMMQREMLYREHFGNWVEQLSYPRILTFFAAKKIAEASFILGVLFLLMTIISISISDAFPRMSGNLIIQNLIINGVLFMAALGIGAAAVSVGQNIHKTKAKETHS